MQTDSKMLISCNNVSFWNQWFLSVLKFHSGCWMQRECMQTEPTAISLERENTKRCSLSITIHDMGPDQIHSRMLQLLTDFISHALATWCCQQVSFPLIAQWQLFGQFSTVRMLKSAVMPVLHLQSHGTHAKRHNNASPEIDLYSAFLLQIVDLNAFCGR